MSRDRVRYATPSLGPRPIVVVAPAVGVYAHEVAWRSARAAECRMLCVSVRPEGLVGPLACDCGRLAIEWLMGEEEGRA